MDVAVGKILAQLGPTWGSVLFRTSVIIASANRAILLEDTLSQVVKFFGDSAEIVLSVPDESSIPKNIDPIVKVTRGSRGASAQRNAGIKDASQNSEYFVFFDDDTVPANDYLAEVEKFFDDNPSVLGMHGFVIQNGGLDFSEANKLLEVRVQNSKIEMSKSLYGCNFAVRSSFARQLGFDERLPLYSWLEDLDLARRLLRLGKLSKVYSAQCVHLMHSSGGRENHKRFGFSQIVNPIYLMQKNSINFSDTIFLVGKPLLANILGSLNPSAKYSWRRERAFGNLLGFVDIARGNVRPERATDF